MKNRFAGEIGQKIKAEAALFHRGIFVQREQWKPKDGCTLSLPRYVYTFRGMAVFTCVSVCLCGRQSSFPWPQSRESIPSINLPLLSHTRSCKHARKSFERIVSAPPSNSSPSLLLRETLLANGSFCRTKCHRCTDDVSSNPAVRRKLKLLVLI